MLNWINPRFWISRHHQKRFDRRALAKISRIGRDQKFPAKIQRIIPRLERKGLVRIIEHSDGNYVILTDKGFDERMRSDV